MPDRNGLLSQFLTPEVLEKSSYTSHWEPMRRDPPAIRYKERRCQYIASQINPAGKRIIDFGCGTGLLACYLDLSGAREVVGIEIVPEHLEFAEYLSSVLPTNNVRFTSTLNSPAGTVDAVVLANVITHVYRPFRLLDDLRRCLVPGGLLFIEDNNNAASPIVRRRLSEQWANAETSYRTRRTGGDATYGMTQEQAQFWSNRPDPPSLHSQAPLDPILNIYHENAFHPRDLSHALFNIGFAVRSVRPKSVFDFKRRRAVSALFNAFPRVALMIAPAFEIVAVKV